MKQPKTKKKWIKIGILFIVALLIKLLSLNSTFVEEYYSNGVYIFISRTLRVLFGWLPFSIGDVLYFIAALWLLIKVFRFVRVLIKKQMTKQKLGAAFRNLLFIALVVYIVFNALWGLNYNRRGIAYQLGLHPEYILKRDLYELTDSLLSEVNRSRRELPTQVQYLSNKENFVHAIATYQSIEKEYPFLNYQSSSVKPSLYNLIGNYLGFSGYYNPFSGEAQVNARTPRFLLPYVTCHEMAHQLGYATEDEANFVGYLAATSTSNFQFRYSVYFDLFNYANSDLFLQDSVAARANYKRLDTLVKLDIKTYRQFLRQYENPLEPLVTKLYGNYLKANNQPEGIATYSQVIRLLIAYQKKQNGRI